MSDVALVVVMTKSILTEIAKQSSALGTGLQNAAPGDKTKPNLSIQYLLDISDSLSQLATKCGDLMQSESPK